jgi:single-strand DNA-binding protein
MSGSVNKVILMGNLGQDPVISYSQDGNPIVRLSLATGESWKDKTTGEKKTKTEWHKIVILNNKLAEVAHKYLKKGSKIMIQGQLQTRKWIDDGAIERYVTEVLLKNFKGELIILSDDKTKANHVGGAPFNNDKEEYDYDLVLDEEPPF